MQALKIIFFLFPLMVIGSFKAHAALPLPMARGESISMTDTQEFLAIGDGILLVGFVLWIAYIIFCMPSHTLKRQ